MRKRKLIFILTALLIFSGVWFIFNPVGKFGFCAFGFTIYGSVPRIISDHQIRSDGKRRKVGKTHDLALANVGWLLEPKPDELIISTGWHGITKPSNDILALDGIKVHVIKNEEAIKLFNKLKDDGIKVAIHYHSTC